MRRCLLLLALPMSLGGCTASGGLDEFFSPQSYGFPAVSATPSFETATIEAEPLPPVPAAAALAIPKEEESAEPLVTDPIYMEGGANETPYDHDTDPLIAATTAVAPTPLGDLSETADGRKILARMPSVPTISIAAVRSGLRDAEGAIPEDEPVFEN